MKTTGIVRSIDELGRLVIPKEFRRKLDVNECSPVEINLDGNRIIVTKYQVGCHLCGNTELPTVEFKEKKICEACLNELKGY